MEQIEADLVVIGSGPGGQKAAIQAAKLGKQVVVIEKDSNPGGACLNSGTIPSKSLREAILDLTGYYERSFYGQSDKMGRVSINDLNFRLNKVLNEERETIHRQFRKNGIRLITGIARFLSPYALLAEGDKEQFLVRGEKIVIATGSKPRNPIHVPFDDEVILDSTRLLSIDRVPKTMIVLGGGIVGSEYASFFAALGVEVTVVDKRGHLLPLLDSEIGIHLQTALAEIGLRFLGNRRPAEIRREKDEAVVTFEDGSTIRADTLLYALGRIAGVDGLDLDRAGIELTERGFIPVNPFFQTETPHIYAVGDVIGAPALASTSLEQGRLASLHAFGRGAKQFPELFPVGIYTIPEISSVGYTEDELEEKGYNYEVGRAYYYEIARGSISGSSTGMFKIIFHRETLQVLGVHIIGRGATELIHVGQVAMSHGVKIDYFVEQVFNYPTFAEGYRIAALNGMNKAR